MQHLSDLLATIPIPPRDTESLGAGSPGGGSPGGGERTVGSPLLQARVEEATGLAHDLAGDLPAGHMHVWGGPGGAGKISFLLSLLHGQAAQGRRVVYATYDLAPDSLALRMLAMVARVPLNILPDPGADVETCTLAGEELERVQDAHAALSRLPFSVLPARGFGVPSLRDRLVRMPFRPEVLALDYLQGVIRGPDIDAGGTLRELSDMAAHLHVAVICTVRAESYDGVAVEQAQAQAQDGEGDEDASTEEVSDVGASLLFGAGGQGISAREAWEASGTAAESADRVGWLGPARDADQACPDVCAEVLHNPYGDRATVPLHLDAATGSLERP